MKTLHTIPRLLMLSLVVVCIASQVISANAKKTIIENITVNVTVIVPITVVAQNVQICVNLASGGEQTCQQIVLDPTQTSYTPVNVDLTQEVPVISSGSTNQTDAIASTSSNETSTFAGSSNQTFEPGKSNITNPTTDHESKDTGDNSTASDNHNAKEDKDTNQKEQEKSTQEDKNQDENSDTS